MKSSDLDHRDGSTSVSWEAFGELTRQLTEQLVSAGVEAVVGIARGGLFPAAAVATALRCELHPVRITRRLNDQVISQVPIWRTPVPAEVAGKRVAVIDEIADTGETLSIVAKAVRAAGASHVVTATLAAHNWANPQPDYTCLESDSLIIFPWEQAVLVDGRWSLHPEINAALKRKAEGQEQGDAGPTG